MTQPILACRGLSYRYRDGRPALTGLDLAVDPGEFVVLAGANGSGKSTLCRLFNGLIPHLHGGQLTGSAAVAGHDVAGTPTHVLVRQVGLVLQNPEAQCVGTTVARDLAFGLACQGLSRAAIAARLSTAAAALEITPLLERALPTLSSGELQRVALAGTLALEPAVLVLDEPFAFLDEVGAERLRLILRRLHAQGVTIVVAEHRLRQVTAEATRLLVLQAGRLVADAAPGQLSSRELAAWGLEEPARGHPDAPRRGVGAGERGAAATLGGSRDGQPVVEWEDVWFAREGRPVLRGFDLSVPAGGIVGLLGANGAGKTTALRHANGLLRPQRGTVRVLGRPVGRRPVAELAREVGLVPAHPAHMLFAPTVREEIAAGPKALRRHDPAWCAELSGRFRLEEVLDRAPQRLSAGEQRRVALAAVLAARPRAVLLDEPTAGQDTAGRRAVSDLIAASAAEGVAVIVATHDADWLASLPAGRVRLIEGRGERETA